MYCLEKLQGKGVKKVTKELIKQKLVGVIADLDVIISDESGRADGSPTLRECKEQLSKLLRELEPRGVKVDAPKVVAVVYKAVDLIHRWLVETKYSKS